jgi:polyisoprenoid-binding protein YceI
MTRRPAAAVSLALTALTHAHAQAGVRQIPIDPSMTRISYTVFALDLIPVTATFERFHGAITQDPAHPDACTIQVTIDVTSLRMDDPVRLHHALAPDMLDAAHFPTMQYTGACADKSLVGNLTLHGITHPLTLAMQRDGPQVNCAGMLLRRDYGILGMTGLVGSGVRIRLDVHLPR